MKKNFLVKNLVFSFATGNSHRERKKRELMPSVYVFERKTNGSTAALVSCKKKKKENIDENLGCWEILDFRCVFSKIV